MDMLRLLGPVEFVAAGGPLPLGGPKERAALTLLAIHANDTVSESRLIDALWGDEPPRTADRTIQSYISRLRRSLAAVDGTGAVESAPGGYRLCVDQTAIDAVQAERLAAEARGHSAAGDPERASALLADALGLCVGSPLGEFAHEPWATAEASRLNELVLSLTEERIEADLACGRHDRLIAELETLCAAHPFRERLWSQRMLALYRAGRQADALDSYRKLADRLASELGVDPSPSVKELERSILRQDPALEPPQPARRNEQGLPMPITLAAACTDTFVGRHGELEILRECWNGRADGSCRAVFVGGEPGIGKSSLVSTFAQTLHDQGAVVLFGTCEEDLDVAYQPFAEALRPYVASCPVDVLDSHVRRYGGDIARLVPEITRRLDDVPPPLSAEPGAERYRLFEAVSAMLHDAAASSPVLLVLDDLQWANRSTILLLRHVLRQPGASSLLIIGQYRDTERTAILTDALADLRRQSGVRRLALGGLEEPDVVSYLEGTGGSSLDERGLAFARRLHDETNGSPYFVSEVIRHLLETGAVVRRGDEWTSSLPTEQFELPASIREVIARRIGRLSEATRNVLNAASVIGPAFDITLLEAVQGDEGEATLEALEEAHVAGMVREADKPGTFHFAHELIRHALYEGLSELRRARIQRLVAQALERRPDSAARTAEIAVHYLAGAADGAAVEAIDYAAKAARQAIDRAAYEEAVHFYERGLDVAEWAGLTETGAGCDLLIGLADARWKVGDVLSSRETYAGAADLARRISDPSRLARAALRAGADLGGYAHAMSTDEDLVERLEEALVAIPSGDNELRARLLARLAVELFTTPHAHERRMTFADEAVDIAQRLGDKEVLLYTRHCREWATVGPDLLPATRLERAAAILNLATSLEDLEVAYQARFLRFVAFLEMGDFVGADAEATEAVHLAERLGSPGFVPWLTAYDSLRAWVAGSLDEADDLSAQALEQALNSRLDPQLVFAVIGAQGVLFRYLRDTQGVVGMLEPMIDQFPNFPTLRVGLALLSLYSNDIDSCRRHFEDSATHDLLDMPRDGTWLLNMGMAGACCAALGDKRRAEILYPLLLPYAERWVAAVVTSFGPMTRIVGCLATTMEWYDVAEIHFERALAQTAAVPAPLFEADTRLDLAKMLVKRNSPGDIERAREQLEMCLQTSEDLGLVILEGWARELAAELPPAG